MLIKLRKPCIEKKALRFFGASLLLVALATLFAGCTITTIIEEPDSGYDLAGVAVFGYRDLLLDDATVIISGNRNKVTTTDENGLFAVSDLPEGHYTITVDSLAGRASQQLYLSRDTNVTLRVLYPHGFDERQFLLISGLWEYSIDQYGRLVTTAGTGNWRWRLGTTVPVYINDVSRPPGFQVNWPDEVWAYIRDWPEIADNAISTYRSTYQQNKGIEIVWVPANTLYADYGEGTVGVASIQSRNKKGYLEHVLVLVDVQYGDLLTSSVLGHEIMHAIGANHVDDPDSLMFPYAQAGQRTQLTSDEAHHLKYAFAVAPRQSVPYTTLSVSAQGVQPPNVRASKASGASVVTVLSKPGKPAQVVNGVPKELLQHERVRELFANQNQSGQSGFLWDEIGE